MSNSTHKVEIVPVALEKHPDSNNLSIVKVFGYTVVVRTDDWKDKKIGAYIKPDSIVDVTRPEFLWLKSKDGRTKERIKVRRLRGILSMGLLVPAPEGSQIGDDVTELLSVEHWEPVYECSSINDRNISAPPLYAPKYDIDAYYRYLDLFKEGEPVYVTEKIHGSNCRLAYYKNKMYVGSRNYWKEESETNIFWRAFRNHPHLETFCKNHEGSIIYGEVYGKVGGFPYDTNGVPKFRAFDILKGDDWLNPKDFILDSCFGLPIVPTIKMEWPLNKKELIEMAEGQSLIGNHVREGVVIKPMEERRHPKLGRVFLKLVGEGYYNKTK